MTEPVLDRRRELAARNESVFRQLNEQIEDLAADALFTRFICECMSEGCSDPVSMTLEEYEHVRGHADWFFVLPGHEVPTVEEIVETTDRFVVVAKLGAGAAVAEETNPRRVTESESRLAGPQTPDRLRSSELRDP